MKKKKEKEKQQYTQQNKMNGQKEEKQITAT